MAILLALILCGIITTITTGINPLQVYQSIVLGAFGSVRKTWVTFQNIAILLLIALALTPAFKMKFWNIGGEGQVLIGGLAAAACMICLGDKLPNAVVILCMIVASLAAGAIWGFIPAFFKAKWNTNETLSTLMMNYIATQLVAFYTIVWEVPKGSGKIGIINQNTNVGWLPQIFGSKYLLSIVVAVVITIFMYVYLNYSKQGYEISVVGESENTAKYVGIKVEKVIIRTMLLSGALCGLVGLLLVGGINHTVTTTIAGGQGFTAVLVSWMSKFNPLTMVFSSFLIIFMDRGASEISTNFGLNHSYSDILTGIILFFIIGCEFFITYRLQFRKKGRKGGTVIMWTFLLAFIPRAIVQGIPLLYGSTGEIITEKSGNLNLGIPGVMYVGGICGVIGSFFYERSAGGAANMNGFLAIAIPMLCCLLGSLLMGLLYCFLTVTLRANQNVTGLAMTTFGVGFGNFFGGSLIKLVNSDVPSIALSATSSYFSKSLPFAVKLGWFGKLFLSYGFLAYLAVIIAFAASYILSHTRTGLHLRAVGEGPNTADAAGINVSRYKYIATCVGCMIAGLGGLYYVMDYACGVWSNDAFGDRGWLAIALVIFTIWRPNISVFASFLFGGLYILYLYLPTGIEHMEYQELYKMIPYVVTLLVLVITSMRSKRENQPPASLGLAYFREER